MGGRFGELGLGVGFPLGLVLDGVFFTSTWGVLRGFGLSVATSGVGSGVGPTNTLLFEFVSTWSVELFEFVFVIASKVGSGVGVISSVGSGEGDGVTAAVAK
jgi:hypothetical protein